MQLRTAQRQQARMNLGLQGPSGAGKTMSALLLSYGITGNWSTIALIDTENRSADLYAHLGPFQVLPMLPPYTPESYIQALEVCEKAGIEVVVLDSLSHSWTYLVEYHSTLLGNDFSNWAKVTPRQKALVDRILQSHCHILTTLRVKQDYVLNQKDGKYVPEKVGLKAVMKDGVDYEFTVVFDLDMTNHASVSKDRTMLFAGKPPFLITPDTGKQILGWCQEGTSIEEVRKQIQECTTQEVLVSLYRQYTSWYPYLQDDFVTKRASLEATAGQGDSSQSPIIHPHNFSTNGTHHPAPSQDN